MHEALRVPEQTVIIAKDQPEYIPLPAYRYQRDPKGRIVCCWRPTWRERIRLFFGAPIWHYVLTFNGALQPQLLTLDKPESKSSLSPKQEEILREIEKKAFGEDTDG